MREMKQLRNERTDALMDAVLKLRTRDECYRFFEDLCTITELQSMSQRIEVAMMLRSNAKYNDISEKTGASTATISRVNRCLHYGCSGYNIALGRLEADGADK